MALREKPHHPGGVRQRTSLSVCLLPSGVRGVSSPPARQGPPMFGVFGGRQRSARGTVRLSVSVSVSLSVCGRTGTSHTHTHTKHTATASMVHFISDTEGRDIMIHAGAHILLLSLHFRGHSTTGAETGTVPVHIIMLVPGADVLKI